MTLLPEDDVTKTRALLGVLGGMGPLATVDFLSKLIAETPAERDADHVPVLVYSVPQIPDRPAAILAGGASPLPEMLNGLRTLKAAGAACIAIPCNTAHYWYDALAREAGVGFTFCAKRAGDISHGMRAISRTRVIRTALRQKSSLTAAATSYHCSRPASVFCASPCALCLCVEPVTSVYSATSQLQDT